MEAFIQESKCKNALKVANFGHEGIAVCQAIIDYTDYHASFLLLHFASHSISEHFLAGGQKIHIITRLIEESSADCTIIDVSKVILSGQNTGKLLGCMLTWIHFLKIVFWKFYLLLIIIWSGRCMLIIQDTWQKARWYVLSSLVTLASWLFLLIKLSWRKWIDGFVNLHMGGHIFTSLWILITIGRIIRWSTIVICGRCSRWFGTPGWTLISQRILASNLLNGHKTGTLSRWSTSCTLVVNKCPIALFSFLVNILLFIHVSLHLSDFFVWFRFWTAHVSVFN